MPKTSQREPTSDAVEILRRDLIGDDPRAAAEYEQVKADMAAARKIHGLRDLITGPKADRAAAFDEDDDFCLADGLVDASDEEIEQIAEREAENEVSSSAYEGIPLDKEALRIGLIESYKKLRAEWPAQRRERMAEVAQIGRRQSPTGRKRAKSPQTL